MQQSQCQRHSEQIIFIETQESGERNQGLCAKCVVDKKKEFTLVQDVKNKIDEIKQEAQNISKELHEENIQQLKKIIEQIGGHKTQMVSAIDKIVNNLEQWIQFLEQGIVNYEQNLQSIEVIYMDQFLTELEEMDKKIYENNQTYKETILDQFQYLTKESQVIQKFSESVLFLQLEKQNQNTKYNTCNVKQPKHNRTPALPLTCNVEEHKNKEIIMIDISTSNANVERLGCIYCSYNNTKFTPLTIVQEKWSAYQDEKNQKLKDYQNKFKTKIDFITQQLKILSNFFIKKIDQTSILLNENLQNVTNSILEQLDNTSNEWSTFKYEQIKKIAEILSKKQYIQVEGLYSESEEQIMKLINGTIMSLTETLQAIIIKISELTIITGQDKQSSLEILLQENLFQEQEETVRLQKRIFPDFICQIHKKEKLFDISDKVKTVDRIICPQCIGNQTQLISFDELQEKWLNYQNQTQQLFRNQKSTNLKKIGQKFEAFTMMFVLFYQHIWKIIESDPIQLTVLSKTKNSSLLSEEELNWILSHFTLSNQQQNKKQELGIISLENKICEVLQKMTVDFKRVESQFSQSQHPFLEPTNKTAYLLNLLDTLLQPEVLLSSNQNMISVQFLQKKGELQHIINMVDVSLGNQKVKFSSNLLFAVPFQKSQSELSPCKIFQIEMIKLQPHYQTNISLVYSEFQKVKPKLEVKMKIFKFERKPIDKRKQSEPILIYARKPKKQSFTMNQGIIFQRYRMIKIIEQQENCYALAFNKDSTILVAGQAKNIRIFEFELGTLFSNQILSDHTEDVVALFFMKKSLQFISGSRDKSIKIWGLSNNKQWHCTQNLEGHTGSVYCVIMNVQEDLIISSSWDDTIKFWKKKNSWECVQTLPGHTGDIDQLSLNISQNKLLSCGEDNQAIISTLRVDGLWEMVIKIPVQATVLKGCFLEENVKVRLLNCLFFLIKIFDQINNPILIQKFHLTYFYNISVKNGGTLKKMCLDQNNNFIYQINVANKSFSKIKDINVQKNTGCIYSSQQKYLKERQILLNRSGKTVYLMKKKNNFDFEVHSQFEFQTEHVHCALTEDGEFLVTWDATSKKYQIKKLQYP